MCQYIQTNKSRNPTDQAYKQKRQGKHSPGTYSCSCSCQGVQRSNKQAANKSEHIKWDNKFKQTNQAIEQNKQTNKLAKGSISFTLLLILLLHLSRRQDKQCSNKQAANKSENRKWANKFKQTNQAIKQIKQKKSTSGSVSCSFARRFVQRGFPA